MKTAVKNYFIAALIAFLTIPVTNCKKYEEGPWISLYSAENRVSNSWEITEFLINEHDSLEILCPNTKKVQISLDKDDFQTIYFFDINSHGYWKFIDDKEVFTIDIYNGGNDSTLTIFYNGSYSEWKILRLTQEDFWIQTVYNDSEYSIKMKQKSLID